MRRRAFTLVELLVVIATLGVLLGLGVAVIPLVKERSRAAGCVAMLQQFGTAFRVYATDWRGRVPSQTFLDGSSTALFDRYLSVSSAVALSDTNPTLKCPAYWNLAQRQGITTGLAPAYNTSLTDYKGLFTVNQLSGEMALVFCAGVDTSRQVTAGTTDLLIPQFPHNPKKSQPTIHIPSGRKLWETGQSNVLHLGGQVTTRTCAFLTTNSWLILPIPVTLDTQTQLSSTPVPTTPSFAYFWYGQTRN